MLLELQVIDNGIGIAEEQLTKIFDRFTQAEESTTRRYGGTGLGLSIVQQIITLLDGNIEVESELGKGAVFKVQIPFEIADQKDKEEKSIDQNPMIAELGGCMKILVVEDNPMNQMLMEHLLDTWHCEFRIAENGKIAVDMLRHEPFDLVLMDIQMPEMDGYTATKLIRSELQLATPIVAMTAHAFDGEKEKCIASGMDDYLSKPIREQELTDIINKYASKTTGDDNPPNETIQAEPINTINLAYLRDISGGSEKFEREILKQFIIQTPKELTALQNAFDLKQWTMVRANAHTLKTTTSFLGLQSLLLPQLIYLEKIETDPLPQNVANKINEVLLICNSAIKEAKELLAELEAAPQ